MAKAGELVTLTTWLRSITGLKCLFNIYIFTLLKNLYIIIYFETPALPFFL